MNLSIRSSAHNLIIYISKILPYSFFINIIYKLNQNTIIFFIKKNNIVFFLNFLKKHNILQFKTLIGITATDYPENKERFEISYFLLSYLLNLRISIKCYTDDITPIKSISTIYSSAI